MPKEFKRETAGYVEAEPGTKLVLLRLGSPETPMYRSEHRVIAWEIRKTNLDPDYRWAHPVTIGGIEPDGFSAILFRDGHIHYQTDGYDEHFHEQEFESIEQFGEYAERYFKDLVVQLSCLDCHEYLAGQTPSKQSPVLKNEIWQSIVPGGKGVLCRPCMEKRLSRPLTQDDFHPGWVKHRLGAKS